MSRAPLDAVASSSDMFDKTEDLGGEKRRDMSSLTPDEETLTIQRALCRSVEPNLKPIILKLLTPSPIRLTKREDCGRAELLVRTDTALCAKDHQMTATALHVEHDPDRSKDQTNEKPDSIAMSCLVGQAGPTLHTQSARPPWPILSDIVNGSLTGQARPTGQDRSDRLIPPAPSIDTQRKCLQPTKLNNDNDHDPGEPAMVKAVKDCVGAGCKKLVRVGELHQHLVRVGVWETKQNLVK